jgi:PBP1b-binding outer membrane lipoprotein LpoB
MNKRTLIAIILLAILLASCAPALSPAQDNPPDPQSPAATAAPDDTGNSPSEPGDQEEAPAATIPPTPSPTLEEQVVVLTYEPPNIVMTAMALQLEDNQAKLTQSANQISTLMAESAALETQLASNATQVAATKAVSTGGGNQESSGGKYELPSDVYTVVMVDKSTVFVANRTNLKGAPIMEPYKPRVYITAGTEAWVYKTPIVADGGGIYYESYDPDGDIPEFKIYFKAKHIQIRAPGAKPDPKNFPANVAIAEFIDDYALHVIVGYDKAGKPVMDTYKPYIKYKVGDREIVYPKWIVATGGMLYLPVYDPDGEPSGYIKAWKVKFPQFWEFE